MIINSILNYYQFIKRKIPYFNEFFLLAYDQLICVLSFDHAKTITIIQSTDVRICVITHTFLEIDSDIFGVQVFKTCLDIRMLIRHVYFLA